MGGDQAFLVVVSLAGNCKPYIRVISLYCTLKFWLGYCTFFRYHNIYVLCCNDVCVYVYIYICHGIVQSGGSDTLSK
jgi:hypothetical protein